MRECEFDGCHRKHWSRGLCKGHYWQWCRGQELRPLRTYKRYAAPAPGLKICTRCGQVKMAAEDFYNRVNGAKQSVCKECMKETARARRKAKREAKSVDIESH